MDELEEMEKGALTQSDQERLDLYRAALVQIVLEHGGHMVLDHPYPHDCVLFNRVNEQGALELKVLVHPGTTKTFQ